MVLRPLCHGPVMGLIAHINFASGTSLRRKGITVAGKKLLLIMNVTAIFLITACLTASAHGYSQKVTLDEKNVPIEKVFKVIEQQTGYVFFFDYALLAKAKKVTITAKNADLLQVLDLCFKDQQFSYEIIDKTVVVKKKKPFENTNDPNIQTSVVSATIDVKGKVTNENGDPLEGASVKVKGTTLGTTTNTLGEFTLKAVDENATLIFSYAEHETVEFKVNGRTNITAALKRSEGELKEVVINKGYYTEKQKLSTGNVSTVKAVDIQKQPVNNPLLALQGRVPGLEITQANGVPGSSVKVRIRGQNSFNNGNEPLYIIDGIPYSSQLLPGLGNILGTTAHDLQGNTIFGNPLSFINPADIESIDVLKDADATAIYGSRAANGAILITTKKGKTGKMKVDVNAYTGWGKITRKVPMLNLQQYLQMRREAFNNDGTVPDRTWDYDLTLWDTTRSTDWQKYFIGGTSHYSNIQASISGGNNQVQYLIGAGYNKETTVFPGDFDDSKASVHFNITSSSANQKFKIMLTGSYLSDDNKLFQQDLTKYTYLAPNSPKLFNDDGSLNWAHDASGFSTWNNPMTYMLKKYKNITNNLITNATVRYEILAGLEIKTSLGYTNLQSKEISTSPLSSIDPLYIRFGVKSNSNFADNSVRSWIIEPQISYKRQFGKGKFELLIGSTFQSNNSEGTVISATGFSTDALIENKKAASIINITSTTNTQYKYNAGFARLNYNWADKYLINVTGRRDGSSRFGPANRFHNFGAIGAAWVFSNENFIKNNFNFLSLGKIRGSFGTTGNDQIGDYRYLDLYYATNFNYQGLNGLIANNLFNPALQWEETKKFELALELGLFNDRVYLSGSYFNNKSSNQLLGYALPTIAGFTSINANQDALIRNNGLEIQLNAAIVQGKKLRWTSSINLTKSTNKLVSVGANYVGLRSIVGHSLNSTYNTHFMGVDPATGKYKFLGKNGGAVFSADSFYFDKDLNPDFYGGFQNSFSYNRFQLDILFQFVKQIGMNNIYGNYPGENQSLPNQPTSVLDRWQNVGQIKTIQKFSQDGSLSSSNQAILSSDASYSDASFIRLKNVALSYTIPDVLKSKLRMSNCRFYVQCQNLLTITNYKGLDPETRSSSTLPPLRVITTGIQLTF